MPPRHDHRRFLFLLLALFTQLSGCTLMQLRDESREFYSATVLVGRIWTPPDWQGPVIVAAVTERDGRPVIAHQVRLHEPGGYELIVPDGRYTLLAFGDRDGNGRPDDSDPAGIRAERVTVAATNLVSLLDFPLTMTQAGAVREALPSHSPSPPTHSTQIGAIAELQSPEFSAASGSRGYWTPMEAFRVTGGNIYFLEPYDPDRIPVLFVHGAAGSAQDWRVFFEQLDRGRYQAWFYQYPSGAALESMAHLLYWKLLNLQLRYGFARLHLVAHSMGGLVSRRFLMDHGEQFPQITQFVTISTPWGGETAASLGVNHSPAVVPSWRELRPEGIFLKRLFERPLPPGVSHSLLFGHRGGYSLFRPTTDGTVSLASQLRPEAQAEARFVMGFDEDHTSILATATVVAQVTRLIEAGDRPGLAGRLQVDLSFETQQRTVGGIPSLVLTRRGDATPRPRSTLLPLAATAGTHQFEPIEPGDYEIRLLAPGFRSTPSQHVAKIEDGRMLPVTFTLAPWGWFGGYIVGPADTLSHPAGSYREPEQLPIRAITLAGNGERRTLAPSRSEDPEAELAARLNERDAAIGAFFSFVDLAAGDYELTILADGYAPHVSRHRIEPGVVLPATPFVLQPAK